MGDSYSVKAILSAADKGFSSTLKSAANTISGIDKKISGLAFGVMSGVGTAAFNSIKSSVSGLITEMNSSNAAWKTFEGNMKIIHGDSKETAKTIKKVKGTLQEYAQATIYSSSDMASAYAQLEAVGIEVADELVKGFGGLAGAAEDPAQAMKTLSQQGVQMAAKPTVAWQDFKLMLEQTPAGMAAVAKKMGMTTSELVTAIQDGEISTKKFFNAVKEVGNSKEFKNLAMQYKTVDQAMDGLQETLGNKLNPAFDVLSKKGIDAVSGIIDKMDGLDGEKIAAGVTKIFDKVEAFGTKCQPYVDAFTESFDGVDTAVGDAFTAIKDSLAGLNSEFGSEESIKDFKGAMKSVAGVIKDLAGWANENSDSIAKLITYLPKIAAGIAAFKVAKKVAPFVSLFASGIAKIGSKIGGGIASKLFGTSKAQDAVGKSSATSGTQMLAAAKSYALMGVAVLTIALGFALLTQSAIALSNSGGLAIGILAGMVLAVVGLGIGMAALLKSLAPMSGQLMPVATAFLAMGAAVLMVSIGFALLAVSSIALANAGGAAIGVMVGMVAAIALLAVGAWALAPALTAGAVGFVAFGAAVLMVGAGFALLGVGALSAATALSLIATVLPTLVEWGLQGATSIATLGASMYVFAGGAVVAGASIVVLAAGLVTFGGAMIVAAGGTLALAGALILVNTSMRSIAKNAKATEKALKGMNKSIDAVGSGLDAIGNKAKTALKAVTSTLNDSAKECKTSGKTAGTGYTKGLQSGLSQSPAVAETTIVAVNVRLLAGQVMAYRAGAYMSTGFAQGMLSELAVIEAAAAQMAVAADTALCAKAKIHSPSDLTDDAGGYFGKGWVNGILDYVKPAQKAVEELVYMPQIRTPQFAYAYAGELSEDYSYSANGEYVIEVPLTVDGREFARATATYTQSELNRKQTRENRKRGKV